MSVFLLLLLPLIGSVTATFPTGRCYERTCGASPWNLNIIEGAGQNNKMCFVFDSKECESNPLYNCCDRFRKSLIKVVFPTMPVCNRSVEYVSVNGLRKGGGVFFDNYGTRAELRVTTLNLVEGRIEGTEVCVHLRNECGSWSDFCRLSDNDRQCMFAVFDPLVHSCCPTCVMGDNFNTPSQSVRQPVVPNMPPEPDWPPEPLWPEEPIEAPMEDDLEMTCSCNCKRV